MELKNKKNKQIAQALSEKVSRRRTQAKASLENRKKRVRDEQNRLGVKDLFWWMTCFLFHHKYIESSWSPLRGIQASEGPMIKALCTLPKKKRDGARLVGSNPSNNIIENSPPGKTLNSTYRFPAKRITSFWCRITEMPILVPHFILNS